MEGNLASSSCKVIKLLTFLITCFNRDYIFAKIASKLILAIVFSTKMMLVNACAQLTIYKIVSLVVRLGRDWERCRYVIIIM